MKKTPQRRAPKQIKKPKKKTYNKIYTFIIIALISILLGLAIGIYYGNQIDEVAHDIKEIATVDIESQKQEQKLTYEEKTKALEINYTKNVNNNTYIEEPKKEEPKTFHFEEPNLGEIDKKEEILGEEQNVHLPETIKDTNETKNTQYPEPQEKIIEKPKAVYNKTNKPRLAIIIDDMTTQGQINSVQSLGYTVNMAFLPPTKGHRNSAKITEKLDYYMIHLPLQASSSRYEEERTLHINDTISTIEQRIINLKKLYPNTNYLNNHTGSKFTSNEVAMDKLFEVLKKYNYTFIDSRTTAQSVAEKASKKYGVKMFSRNIFLDNKKDKKYIQNQLKKAIRIAKKTGLAIAIGHPYSITFKTLAESKHLLKGLELVYVQEL
jgi:hypothetical protein